MNDGFDSMILRIFMVSAALCGGILLAVVLPQLTETLRAYLPRGMTVQSVNTEPSPKKPEVKPEAPLVIKLSDAQIASVNIKLAPATGGVLARHLAVPGTILPSADRTARISVQTTGTVAELRKGLGDKVAKGEIVALLDSREIADAKGEYLAARVAADLQKTLFQREQELWDRRVSSEQQYLRARASFEDQRVKVDAARRKLRYLGLGTDEIEALPNLPAAQFERQEIRSPIAGRIVDRRVDLGTAVGRDNLETELYSVVDLSQVWIDLAVMPGDLPLVREGQKVRIFSQAASERTEGRIIFMGPVLDRDTRSARVVAEVENPNETWRPGSFVSAEIAIADQPVPVLVPAEAIQRIDGKPNVFVRTSAGFEPRPIGIGRTDDGTVEVTSGLAAGETIVIANSFILKAELRKSQVED